MSTYHPSAATGDTAVAVSISFTVASGVALCLRCVSRFIVLRKAGVDDLLVILSFLSSTALTYAICFENRYGLGKDLAQLSYDEIVEVAKYMWIATIAYWMALTFVKLSALTQYLRFLFLRPFRIACWTAIILCSACGIAGFFSSIFACQPVSHLWDKTITGAKCINYVAWLYFASAWTIGTDVVVLVIPIIAFKDLKMPTRQKRALIGIFALGALGCIASILRINAIYIATVGSNFTFDGSCLAWWSSIEVNVGIVCVSLPSIKPLFTIYWPRQRIDGRNAAGEKASPASSAVPLFANSFTESGSVQSDTLKSKEIVTTNSLP